MDISRTAQCYFCTNRQPYCTEQHMRHITHLPQDNYLTNYNTPHATQGTTVWFWLRVLLYKWLIIWWAFVCSKYYTPFKKMQWRWTPYTRLGVPKSGSTYPYSIMEEYFPPPPPHFALCSKNWTQFSSLTHTSIKLSLKIYNCFEVHTHLVNLLCTLCWKWKKTFLRHLHYFHIFRRSRAL